jgi:N-acetyl-anhydromuramyl-L-alanine amidase AmpD
VIVGSDAFRNVCRITRDGFAVAIAARPHNTGLESERDLGAYWDESRAWSIDPCFTLAMAIHESQLLTAGVAVTTKSFGNTRNPSFGATPVGETPGRTGTFPVFATFLDGCTSTVARLASTVWPHPSPYGLRPSIESVFNDPSGANWAPFGDGGNDPNSYLSSMLRIMNQYADQADEPITGRTPLALTITDRLTPVNYTTGRGGHRVKALVAHITDGETAAGAIGWFHNPASKVSAHYVVDRDGTITRVVREENTAWANGVLNQPNVANPIVAGWVRDGTNPNSETVSIEAVGKPNQGWTTKQLAVVDVLNRDIAARWNIPVNATTVIGHKDIDSVNRARCPSLTPAQWTRMRQPAMLTDDQKMEAYYQAHAARLGPKKYAAQLSLHYYVGPALVCAYGVVTPDGEAITGYLVDDWETYQAAGITKL